MYAGGGVAGTCATPNRILNASGNALDGPASLLVQMHILGPQVRIESNFPHGAGRIPETTAVVRRRMYSGNSGCDGKERSTQDAPETPEEGRGAPGQGFLLFNFVSIGVWIVVDRLYCRGVDHEEAPVLGEDGMVLSWDLRCCHYR